MNASYAFLHLLILPADGKTRKNQLISAGFAVCGQVREDERCSMTALYVSPAGAVLNIRIKSRPPKKFGSRLQI
jgi:hypothetical protein